MSKIILTFLFLASLSLNAQMGTAGHRAYDNGEIIKIVNETDRSYFKPLDEIKLNVSAKGTITVIDSRGNEYYSSATSADFSFKAGGALGSQMIIMKDKSGKILDKAIIQVNCKTEINDEKGEFKGYLKMLKNSMDFDSDFGNRLYNDKVYATYNSFFQDNVHSFKGHKYFDPRIKDFVDLYADSQREDGMIYDFYFDKYDNNLTWLDRFGAQWLKVPADKTKNSSFFVRVPIENEPEFSFLEGVYYVWKATGDDEWMKQRLENCLKAINYTRTDPYRWSEKFQLTKRVYTIDIWDFMCDVDGAPYRFNDTHMAELDKARFGISYADNIGMVIGIEYVSEMLAYFGRKNDAEKYAAMAAEWRKRTDDLCWNGKFYTHWIPEDSTIVRDFGTTDVSKQVSLSNSYCLNRRISHEKAVEIIKSYQRIREEMPKTSPGEWYLLYPPFEKGFELKKWEYMNGGVSPIVAGELSHGAFEHGYEDYGVDIIRRVCALADKSGGHLYDTYKGALSEKPVRIFTTLSLKDVANADFAGDKKTPGVNSWTEEDIKINDMINFPIGKQLFQDIPFEIIDPVQNGRKACMVLSACKGFPKSKIISVNAKAQSLYLVHSKTGSEYAGYIKINYADGTFFKKNIVNGKQISGWWFPQDVGECKVAWKGPNRFCLNVGMFVWGLNNPEPDKIIKNLEFVNDNIDSKWMISGLTLSDYKVWYDPGIVSYGIPSNWADAAVIYAIVEGLAGVKDAGVAFNKTLLAPRWKTADINKAEVTIRYEASKGYVSYKYTYDVTGKQLFVLFTGNAVETNVELLLPKGTAVSEIYNNGALVQHQIKKIESSEYAVFTVAGTGVNNVVMKLK